jgi:hypothetical protein
MYGNFLYRYFEKNHAFKFLIFSNQESPLLIFASLSAHDGLRDFKIAQSNTLILLKKSDEKLFISSVKSLSVQTSRSLKSLSTLIIRIGVRGVPSPIATSGHTGTKSTNFCNL